MTILKKLFAFGKKEQVNNLFKQYVPDGLLHIDETELRVIENAVVVIIQLDQAILQILERGKVEYLKEILETYYDVAITEFKLYGGEIDCFLYGQIIGYSLVPPRCVGMPFQRAAL